MKRIICVCLMLWMMLTWGGAETEEGSWKKIFSNDDLPGTMQGICFGSDVACVYSSEGYLLLDENGNIRTQYVIDHPQIREDASFVMDAVYQDDMLWMMIFDFSVEKSYIIKQEGFAEPQYGMLMEKSVTACAVVEDGICLAGLNENLMPWCACMGRDGEMVWERHQETRAFDYQGCVSVGEKIYIVGDVYGKPMLCLMVMDKDGEFLESKRISMPNALMLEGISDLHVFDIYADSDEIVLVGEQLSQNAAHGFCLILNKNLEIVDGRDYEEYKRIAKVVKQNEQYMLFATGYNRKRQMQTRTLISMDDSVVKPIYANDAMSLALGMQLGFHEKLYIYGNIYQTKTPAESLKFVEIIE